MVTPMLALRSLCVVAIAALLSACSPAPAAAPPRAPTTAATPPSASAPTALPPVIPAIDPVGARRPAPDTDADDPEGVDTRIYKVPVGSSPVSGPAAAPVTIVVFSDFQCPFCKDMAQVLTDVRREFPTKVRLVFKHQPLPPSMHPRAEPASQLAIEARGQKGDAGFWQAHDLLFASAPLLGDDDLARVARAIGLDPARAANAVTLHRHTQTILEDIQLGDSVGVRATPTVFVNGFKFEGGQPLEFFRAIIPAVLPIAESIARQGVAPERVYEEIIRDGVTMSR